METTGVSNFRLIALLHQCVKSGADQGRNAAAENHLLAKKISLRLLGKRRTDYASTGAAKGGCVGKGESIRLSASVLIHSPDRQGTQSFEKEFAHHCARAIGSDHRHIDIRRRHHLRVMNTEAMCDQQHHTRPEIGANISLIHLVMSLIRKE